MSEHRDKKSTAHCNSAFPDMLTAASVVSISLTGGRDNAEVETLLNFIGLLECNIKFILSQRLIDDRHRIGLDIDFGD